MSVPSRVFCLSETIGFMLLNHFAAKLAVGAAALAGLTLPDMPLLHRTYIAFAAIVALMLWLGWRGEPLARFGLVRPRWRDLGLGIALALVLMVVHSLVRTIATPLIVQWTGANPHLAEQTFAAIRGNLPLFLMTVPVVWLFAGLGEEFLFRGYLMTRLSQLFGGGRLAWGMAIASQAILFALSHWYQGPVGMVPIGVGAVVTGIATVAWGRNLWPAIIAHALIDTLGFTVLYLGLPLS